jgi:hypothetical protein
MPNGSRSTSLASSSSLTDIALTEAWKISDLRKDADGFFFLGLTAGPETGERPRFGIRTQGERFHAYVDRGRTWFPLGPFRQLGEGTAVQLHVNLRDLHPQDLKQPDVVSARSQEVIGVYVPTVCRGPSGIPHVLPNGADLCLRFEGPKVLPSCRSHANGVVISLTDLSAELERIPVARVVPPH